MVSLPRFSGKGTLFQIGADYVPQLILRAKSSRLLAHVLDQLGSLDAFGKSRKIFHQRGERELPSGLMAFDHQWLQVGASGVKAAV